VLEDAEQHETDSSEVAFENAARLACNHAAEAGEPTY
jgi:translation elongation factor EF-G